MILNNASDVRRGTNLTEYVYRGSTLVWQRKHPHPHPDPYVPVPGERHYGVRFKGASFEYLYDAEGKVPASVSSLNGIVNLNGWSSAFFVRNNYPCMLTFDGYEEYKLNPYDHRYRIDGELSDYNNLNFPGNAMSCFNCPIWLKFYKDSDDYFCIEVADSQLDSDFVNYPYIRADESTSERMYYPMYTGTLDTEGRLRSIGVGTVRGTTSTYANLVQAAENNGDRWQINSFAFKLWINVLLFLMFNGDSVINKTGRASFDNYQNGTSYDRGQFNYLYSGNTSSAHKTFFCEWLWGGRYSLYRTHDVLNGLYYKSISESGMWRNHIFYKMHPPYSVDGDLQTYQSVIADVNKFELDKSYGILPNELGSTNQIKPFGSSGSFLAGLVYPYKQDNAENHCLYFGIDAYDTVTSSVYYV